MKHSHTLAKSQTSPTIVIVAVLATAAVSLFCNQCQAQPVSHPTGGVFNDPSPKVEKAFSVELLTVKQKEPVTDWQNEFMLAENGGVLPNGTVYPQVTGKDALTTYTNSLERIVALQQRNSANNPQFPPKKHYILRARQNIHEFHPKPPYNQGVVWGYDGTYPGPTFKSKHGEPLLVRIFNDLFFDKNGKPVPLESIPGGFGNPQISTHLHNGHTGSESDGNPADFYPPTDTPHRNLPHYPDSIRNLVFRDHHYAMFRAGLNPNVDAGPLTPNKDDGDIAESISTLWYHDHSHHHTAANTYKGLVGFHLVFDEIDSDDEEDANPKALRLPSGDFDIPLLIQDKQFRLDNDGNAQLFVPQGDDGSIDGLLGDVFLVNGRIQPTKKVTRRKYRFRLLNAGPSRFYQLYLVKREDLSSPPEYHSFFQIGNDESLLEKPFVVEADQGLLLSVSERADIVIDFKNFSDGDKLYLVNRLVMNSSGAGPVAIRVNNRFARYRTLLADESDGQGDHLLEFEVTGGDVDDPSRLPDALRKSPVLPRVSSDLERWVDGNPVGADGLTVGAKKGRTLVFRQADPIGEHGLRFTDENLVLLKSDPAGSKPNAVLEQIDNLGLYGQQVPAVMNDPVEIARFKVIKDIATPLAFECAVQAGLMFGRVEQAGVGESENSLPEITVDAGPGIRWNCGLEHVASSQLITLSNHRHFRFETNADGNWVVNGRLFTTSPAGQANTRVGRLDVPRSSALPGDGPDGEVWTIENSGRGWAHPVHIHLEEFRILRRNGDVPKEYERCKKDVLRLDPDEKVQIFLRFRDFLGKYPIHCHNVLHEDHEMMLRFDVVGDN